MIMETDELYLSILLYAGAPPNCDEVREHWPAIKRLFAFVPNVRIGYNRATSDQWIDWYAAFRRAFELTNPTAEEQDYTDHAVKYANWCRQRAAAQRVSVRRNLVKDGNRTGTAGREYIVADD